MDLTNLDNPEDGCELRTSVFPGGDVERVATDTNKEATNDPLRK